MQFLPEGHSEQTMILNLCGSAKYITVLCFSIRGGDAGVSAQYRTWNIEFPISLPNIEIFVNKF